jgi:ATP-binding cassette subfamily A (ABC1) protein 3
MSEVSSEMTFQLPTESSAKFKEFFSSLDENLDKLNILSYGVGVTTLEEVFLKIGKGEGSDLDGEIIEEESIDKGMDMDDSNKNSINHV